MSVRWVIHYADGTRFVDTQGSAVQAPLDGVQAIIIAWPDDRQVIQGHDYYLWLGDTWAGGSQADLDRWIRAGYVHPGAVKFGLVMQRGLYRAIIDEVLADGP